MVHRLDPRYPVVWRSPSSVQIGVDPARVVLEDVGVGAERMLAALVSGATAGGLGLLAGGEDPEGLLATLAPVLERPEVPQEHGVAVYGLGPTAVRLCRLLEDDGRWRSDGSDAPPYPAAVVIVSHYVTPPASRSVWLRRDVIHLPVVYSDTGVVVGPLVLPGRGPCLTCVEFHHRDRDPAWPALATQLLGRRSTADQGAVSAEAAASAARMLANGVPGIVVRIEAVSGARSESTVTQHPQCSCTGGGPLDAAAALDSAQLGEEPAR